MTSNYDPGVVDGGWTGNQISEYIEILLVNCSTYFGNWDVPEPIETSVPCIAHLVASLSCFEDIVKLSRDQHLDQLKKTGAFSLVHAGMPGPCLIYLQALLAAPGYDAISKMMLLGNVIDSLTKKENLYGILDAVVLPVLIENWFSLLCTLTSKQQDLFCGKATYYGELKEKSYDPLIKDDVTFIDQCIMNVWDNLHIDYDLNTINKVCHRNM